MYVCKASSSATLAFEVLSASCTLTWRGCLGMPRGGGRVYSPKYRITTNHSGIPYNCKYQYQLPTLFTKATVYICSLLYGPSNRNQEISLVKCLSFPVNLLNSPAVNRAFVRTKPLYIICGRHFCSLNPISRPSSSLWCADNNSIPSDTEKTFDSLPPFRVFSPFATLPTHLLRVLFPVYSGSSFTSSSSISQTR